MILLQPKNNLFLKKRKRKNLSKNNAKNILFLWQNMMFFPARMQYASIEETPQNIYVWNQNIPVSFHPENKTLKNEKKKNDMPFVSAPHSSVVGLHIYTLVIQ